MVFSSESFRDQAEDKSLEHWLLKHLLGSKKLILQKSRKFQTVKKLDFSTLFLNFTPKKFYWKVLENQLKLLIFACIWVNLKVQHLIIEFKVDSLIFMEFWILNLIETSRIFLLQFQRTKSSATSWENNKNIMISYLEL